jgi:hypothetical protein
MITRAASCSRWRPDLARDADQERRNSLPHGHKPADSSEWAEAHERFGQVSRRAATGVGA